MHGELTVLHSLALSSFICVRPFDAHTDLIRMTSDQISQLTFASSFGQLPAAIKEAESLLEQKREDLHDGKVVFQAGKSLMAQHLDT